MDNGAWKTARTKLRSPTWAEVRWARGPEGGFRYTSLKTTSQSPPQKAQQPPARKPTRQSVESAPKRRKHWHSSGKHHWHNAGRGAALCRWAARRRCGYLPNVRSLRPRSSHNNEPEAAQERPRDSHQNEPDSALDPMIQLAPEGWVPPMLRETFLGEMDMDGDMEMEVEMRVARCEPVRGTPGEHVMESTTSLVRALVDISLFMASCFASSTMALHALESVFLSYALVFGLARMWPGSHFRWCRPFTALAVGGAIQRVWNDAALAMCAMVLLALCPRGCLWWPGGFDSQDSWHMSQEHLGSQEECAPVDSQEERQLSEAFAELDRKSVV